MSVKEKKAEIGWVPPKANDSPTDACWCCRYSHRTVGKRTANRCLAHLFQTADDALCKDFASADIWVKK
jgi:hypothetical protein